MVVIVSCERCSGLRGDAHLVMLSFQLCIRPFNCAPSVLGSDAPSVMHLPFSLEKEKKLLLFLAEKCSKHYAPPAAEAGGHSIVHLQTCLGRGCLHTDTLQIAPN